MFLYRPVRLTCAHIHPIQRLLAYCIVCVNMFYTVASSIIITQIYPECGTIFFPPKKQKKETYSTYSINKQRLNWWTLSLVEILDGKQYIYIYI